MSTATGTTYSVKIKNNGTHPGSFALYKEDPDMMNPDTLILAWLAEPSANGQETTISWTVDYSFYWTKVKSPEPGTTISSTASKDGDLKSNNSIGFSKLQGGTYVLSETSSAGHQNILYVHQDETIEVDDNAFIGILIDNQPVIAKRAQPSTITEFTPHPTYYLIYGDIEQGAVIDVSEYSDQALKITFDSVTEHNVVLNERNQLHLV
ncbi:hypothetical protein D3C74_53570 [compost metagenome]